MAVEEEDNFEPRIKISETLEKITNPGRKKVYRIYSQTGNAIADLITGANEQVDMLNPYVYVDPDKPWKHSCFENCRFKELQTLVLKDGKRVNGKRSLCEVRDYVKEQLQGEIWQEEQRFENPHKHYINMSPVYYEMKIKLLNDVRSQS